MTEVGCAMVIKRTFLKRYPHSLLREGPCFPLFAEVVFCGLVFFAQLCF